MKPPRHRLRLSAQAPRLLGRIRVRKYLLTGQAGAGKSSVAAELRRRGFAAYDTDAMPEVTGFDYADSGLPVGPGEIQHPNDFARFSWNWRQDRLLELLASADDVFVCAITSNTVELAHLFDRVFVLVPDREALAERLRTRTDNAFGKHPAEAEPVLAHNDVIAAEWRDRGGIPIDANRPLVASSTTSSAGLTDGAARSVPQESESALVRRYQALLKHVAVRDRIEVARAVERGRSVSREDLAEVAVAYARLCQERPRRWSWSWWLGWLEVGPAGLLAAVPAAIFIPKLDPESSRPCSWQPFRESSGPRG